jgi:peptidoglycan/xylan/chitin deacetylase (PgdA/CDA1 family)
MMLKLRCPLFLLPMLLLTAYLAIVPSASAQQEARLSGSVSPDNGLALAVQPEFHFKYGCLYPMTYRVRIPDGSSGLMVERRHSSFAAWDVLPEKTSADLFNGIEAVRFDYTANLAHVSAAFSSGSDSLFLRIRNAAGDPTSLVFEAIDTYYDDRRAAVTVSADDWCDVERQGFSAVLDVFRSYGLYVTCGVITGPGWSTSLTWGEIQREADLGNVEVASHSRTHVLTPYADPAGEVEGSADDIVSHVRLPALFSANGRQYVYVWLAPFGSYDATVDSLVGARGYLVPRLYNNVGQWSLGAWDPARLHFEGIQATMEIGNPAWGGGCTDSSVMNAYFDYAVSSGQVYHLMWHPQVIFADLAEPYFLEHLQHISGRTDIWYANLGPLYLYHMIEEANRFVLTTLTVPGSGPGRLKLHQNHPNPFNATTTIGFEVAERALVSVRIFDVQGQRVATLVDGAEEPGRYSVTWDSRKVPSGTYFCRLEATTMAGSGGKFTSTRKLQLVR